VKNALKLKVQSKTKFSAEN